MLSFVLVLMNTINASILCMISFILLVSVIILQISHAQEDVQPINEKQREALNLFSKSQSDPQLQGGLNVINTEFDSVINSLNNQQQEEKKHIQDNDSVNKQIDFKFTKSSLKNDEVNEPEKVLTDNVDSNNLNQEQTKESDEQTKALELFFNSKPMKEQSQEPVQNPQVTSDQQIIQRMQEQRNIEEQQIEPFVSFFSSKDQNQRENIILQQLQQKKEELQAILNQQKGQQDQQLEQNQLTQQIQQIQQPQQIQGAQQNQQQQTVNQQQQTVNQQQIEQEIQQNLQQEKQKLQQKLDEEKKKQQEQTNQEVEGQTNQQELGALAVKDNSDIINGQGQQLKQQKVKTNDDNPENIILNNFIQQKLKDLQTNDDNSENIILNNIIQQKLEDFDEQGKIGEETDENEENVEATEISNDGRQQMGTTTDAQQIEALKQYFNDRSHEEQGSNNINFLKNDDQEQN